MIMKKNRTTTLCRRLAVLTVLLLCMIGMVTALPNLTVTAVTSNPSAGNCLFANEPNTISATIRNNGDLPAINFNIRLDVGSYSETKRRTTTLNANSQTTITFNGYNPATIGDVTITVTADSSGEVTESKEDDNVLEKIQTVYYNGYKGKRFTSGSDLNTQAGPFEGHYGIVYSAGNSAYNAAGWTSKTYTWNSGDLEIPEGATITSARLYQGYTWDETSGGIPLWTMTFNGNAVTPAATYLDTKGFGMYNDYEQGLFVYDVTSQFLKTGNSMTITPQAENKNGIYGAYLVVVYEDPSTSLKKIWINDECDILASANSYSATSDEATAYANFAGVDASDVASAHAIAILQSAADSGKSKFFFNSNEYAGFWSAYQSAPQIGFSTYDVTNALTNGANTARLQSYDSGSNGDNMYATNVILIVEKSTPAPSIEITLGSSTVKLTNMVPGQDASNQTTVNVVASNGNSWSIKASDEKTTNKGFMVKGSTPLSSVFQLGKNGGDYRALTSDYTSFMSGSTMGSHSATANLKQPVVEGDAGGTYGITVTFTGSIS